MAEHHNHDNCPSCGECCTQPCHDQIDCVYLDSCYPCCHIPIAPGFNQHMVGGTILAQSSLDNRFYPYDPAGTDGLNIPRGILMHGIQTDSSGAYAHYRNGITPDCYSERYTNMYMVGTFRSEHITGNLSSAVASGAFGRIVTGNATTGLFLLT